MFLKKKLSKTTKNTIVKTYGRLKGRRGRRKAPPQIRHWIQGQGHGGPKVAKMTDFKGCLLR